MKIVECIVTIILSLISKNFSRNISTRVAGGSHAKPGEFPYVALSIHTDIKCTAVVISNEYILGAAHCYWANKRSVKPSDVMIITGLTNINNINTNYTQKRQAEKIFINPYFKEKKLGRNDIAVVKLNRPLFFNEFTSAIYIDAAPFPIGEEVLCTAIGWGDIRKNVEATNLVKLQVKAKHSDDACHGLSKQQYSSLICVAEPESGKGLCDGDSGGPLINGNRLIGIAHQVYKELHENDSEFDLECGMKGLVHTFMFICKHLNWIKSFEKSLPDQPSECYVMRSNTSQLDIFNNTYLPRYSISNTRMNKYMRNR